MKSANVWSTIGIALAAILSASASAQSDAPRLNKLIDLFEQDEPAFGLLSFDYSLTNARTMSSSGLDFILIDMEHAPFDVERLRAFLLGMTNKRSILEKGNLQPDVVPFVRIPAAGGADEIRNRVKRSGVEKKILKKLKTEKNINQTART